MELFDCLASFRGVYRVGNFFGFFLVSKRGIRGGVADFGFRFRLSDFQSAFAFSVLFGGGNRVRAFAFVTGAEFLRAEIFVFGFLDVFLRLFQANFLFGFVACSEFREDCFRVLNAYLDLSCGKLVELVGNLFSFPFFFGKFGSVIVLFELSFGFGFIEFFFKLFVSFVFLFAHFRHVFGKIVVFGFDFSELFFKRVRFVFLYTFLFKAQRNIPQLFVELKEFVAGKTVFAVGSAVFVAIVGIYLDYRSVRGGFFVAIFEIYRGDLAVNGAELLSEKYRFFFVFDILPYANFAFFTRFNRGDNDADDKRDEE